MYLNGLGASKDYNLAFNLFSKAAAQSHANGQANLGYMYEKGYGVTRNLTEARIWYQKAADQGNTFAQRRLNNL